MYYKGYIIKDRQIPTSGHVLTDEGMESILKHQDIPLVDMIYRKIGSCKVLRDGDDIFLVAQFDYPINPFLEFDVDESLGQVFFSTTYRSMDFGKEGVREIDEITVDRVMIDLFTRDYMETFPEIAKFMGIKQYFKLEDAYAKQNKTTDNGRN